MALPPATAFLLLAAVLAIALFRSPGAAFAGDLARGGRPILCRASLMEAVLAQPHASPHLRYPVVVGDLAIPVSRQNVPEIIAISGQDAHAVVRKILLVGRKAALHVLVPESAQLALAHGRIGPLPDPVRIVDELMPEADVPQFVIEPMALAQQLIAFRTSHGSRSEHGRPFQRSGAWRAAFLDV